MCRVEERIYTSAQGHRSTTEDKFPCDKARKGRLCANVKKRTTTYHLSKGTISSDSGTITTFPLDPPTPPDSGSNLAQQKETAVTDRLVRESSSHSPQSSNSPIDELSTDDVAERRRPSEKSSRLSTRHSGNDGVKPEIVIEYGGRKDKSKKYPAVSVQSKTYRRGSFSSDASYTLRTGFPEAPLPLPQQIDSNHRIGTYNTSLVIPRGHCHDSLSDTSSFQGSNRTLSLYFTSDSDFHWHTSGFSSGSQDIPRVLIPSRDVRNGEILRQRETFPIAIRDFGASQKNQRATPETVTIALNPTKPRANDQVPLPASSPGPVAEINAGGDEARLPDEDAREVDVVVEAPNPQVGSFVAPGRKSNDDTEPSSKRPEGLNREVLAGKEDRPSFFEGARDHARALDRFFTEKDTLFTEKDTLFTEKDTLFTEKDTLFTEKDTLFTEKDTLFTEKDTLFTEKDTIFTEKDTIFAAREKIRAEMREEMRRKFWKEQEEDEARLERRSNRRYREEEEELAGRERMQKTITSSETNLPPANSGRSRGRRQTSIVMTQPERDEQLRRIADDLHRMEKETRAAKAKELGERETLLRQQQQDPSYYNPRTGSVGGKNQSYMGRSRPSSMSRQGPIPAQTNYPLTRARQHQLPPVFYNNLSGSYPYSKGDISSARQTARAVRQVSNLHDESSSEDEMVGDGRRHRLGKGERIKDKKTSPGLESTKKKDKDAAPVDRTGDIEVNNVVKVTEPDTELPAADNADVNVSSPGPEAPHSSLTVVKPLTTTGDDIDITQTSPLLMSPQIKTIEPESMKPALKLSESGSLESSYTEEDVYPHSVEQAMGVKQHGMIDVSKPASLTISLAAPKSEQQDIHEFVSWGKRLQDSRETISATNTGGQRSPFSYRAIADRIRSYFEAAMITSGYLEPPLEPDFVRLRWRCKCGDRFYGDVFEYREGGVKRLIQQMQRSLGTKVVSTTYDKNTPDQRYILRLPSWMRTTKQKLSATFGQSKTSPSYLPQHANQAATSACAPMEPVPSQQQSLHLMACMQNGRYRRTVHQDRIDDITTDRDLFSFMGKQLSKRRGYIRKAFSLKCIQGLYFVKFRLWSNGSAEVREHVPCCTLSATSQCECIPPASKVHPADDAEYICTPAGPLDVWPPILSQQLMHMLTSPECIHEDETLVLDQLPKRTCGELEGKVREPAEGWGLHYQEGQDFEILMGVVFIGLMASLLFAILWSHFKHDVQGAFGVASYIVTAVAAFVALVVNRAGRLG